MPHAQEGEPEDLKAVTDRYLAAWKQALATGEVPDGTLDQFLADEYTAHFGYPGLHGLQPVNRAQSMEGFRRQAAFLKGAAVRVENRLVRARSADEVLAFYERTMECDDGVMITFLVVETWGRTGGTWRLIREVMEGIGE